MGEGDLGRGPAIIAAGWTLTGLAVALIAARFYIRIVLIHHVSLDDWLMLVAGVLQVVVEGFATQAFMYGLGKHDRDLTFDELINVLKWIWLATLPGLLVTIIARWSISVLLVRIFGSKKWFKYYIIIFTGLITLFTLALLIVIWVQVYPLEGLWNPLVPARRWDSRVEQYTAYVAGSFVAWSDLTYVLFPVMIIWQLQMPFKRKFGLCICLTLSFITLAFSILKTVTAQGSNTSSDDAQYTASLNSVWNNTEQCLVIIMGCIPTLLPVRNLASVRKIISLLQSSLDRTTWSRKKNIQTLGSSENRTPYYELNRNSTTQEV
ncbi:hypothetical protein F4859DRAFT_481528 [Xylaria cf. heliscus]|nr:hypothetical protein F4859DRAFT_481528 [Xylaria cf. heliscus]